MSYWCGDLLMVESLPPSRCSCCGSGKGRLYGRRGVCWACASVGRAELEERLGGRLANLLARHQLFFADEVVAMSNADLLLLREFGGASLKQVRERLG